MNQKTIITILLALVAVAGQAQIHYRLEGNIGMPEFTGIMEVQDVLKQQPVDTIKVVNGVITPKEGDLPEMALCVLSDTTKNIVLIDSIPCRISALTLAFLYIDNGITMIEGLKDNWLQQSGTAISVEIAAVNQRMEEIQETYGNGDEGKKVLADFERRMSEISIIKGEFEEKLKLMIAPQIMAGFPSPAEDYLHESIPDFSDASPCSRVRL